MSRYKITIEYDGTGLLGWQKQLDGPSVQEYIEKAIYNFSKNKIHYDSETKNFTFIFPEENKDCKDSSIGFCNQISHANNSQEIDFRTKDGSKTRSTEAQCTLGVHEHSNIGSCNQISHTNNSREIDFRTKDGSKTRSTEAQCTLGVHEHSSIGFCDQISHKINLPFIVYGSGRTDAGVHAIEQVAHFDLETEMNDYKLREAINAHLVQMKANVAILDVEKVHDEFHARFDAKKRSYIYRILNRRAKSPLKDNRVWHVNFPLDIEKMKEASEFLIGKHDFSSFRAIACQAKSPIKTIEKIEINQKGDEIEFYFEAPSFLHHQIRNIVGTLKEIGEGKKSVEDMSKILNAKDRKKAGATAPACGLYLYKIWY